MFFFLVLYGMFCDRNDPQIKQKSVLTKKTILWQKLHMFVYGYKQACRYEVNKL